MEIKQSVIWDKIESEIALRNNEVEVTFNGAKIGIRKTLGIEDAILFVNNIVDMCIDKQEMDFMGFGFDIAVREEVVSMYGGFELTGNIDEDYDILYKTDLFKTIEENIDSDQYKVLINAAREQIEFYKSAFVSTAALQVNRAANKFEGALNDLNEQAMSLEKNGELKNMIQKLIKNGVIKG